MYSIRLNDGTVISNLELNGNNFIPESTINKTIFENNLEKVIITDDDGNEEERFKQKVQFAKIGDTETFILHNKTKEEIEKEILYQLLADLTEEVLFGGVE
jgi:hypothetical protein